MAVTQALLTYEIDRQPPVRLSTLLAAVATVPLFDGNLLGAASVFGITLFADVTSAINPTTVRRQILFSLSPAFTVAFPTGTDQAAIFRSVFKHQLGSALKSKVVETPPTVEEFFPSSLAGAYFWARADRGTVGTPLVDTWTNQIASPPVSVTQAVNANKPTLVASDPAYGNQPILSFVGAANWLDSPAFVAHAQPTSTFAVGQIDNLTGQLVGGTGANEQLLLSAGATEWAIASGAGPLVAVGSPSNVPSVVVAAYDDAVASELYVNNVVVPAASGVAGANSLTQFAIGATVGGGLGMTGKVADVALFNGHLAQMDRQRLRLYAQDTYGL